MTDSNRFRGIVQTYKQPSGFGFITPFAGQGLPEQDLFVHVSSVELFEGSRELTPGDHVSFQIGTDRRGRPKAVNVIIQLKSVSKPNGLHS